MAHAKNHDYHILPPSLWPFIGAVSAFLMLAGMVSWMHEGGPWIFVLGLIGVLFIFFAWCSDMAKEGLAGEHSHVIRIGLRMGFFMFIISEVFFFLAWFWAFFKFKIFPTDIQNPIDIEAIDPWHLPLMNTLVLLLSGCFVTWAHHDIAHNGDNKSAARNLLVAVCLGVLFTALQAYEYMHAGFGMAGHVDRGVFFMATGFHGFHVIIGTIFLLVCYFRAKSNQFTKEAHVGFEMAAWYWHFVDVVWLFLFFAVYIWGGSH